MIELIKRHKILSLMVFLNVVIILVVVLVIVIHNSKTATVDIMVAPESAEIKLNGSKYNNMESYSIAPGDYHVSISMEGMRAKEFDVEIKDGELERIWTYLLDSDGGFSYYANHPEDATILEDVADDEARAFLEEYDRLTSIQSVLPLEYYDRSDPNNPIGVFIEQSEEGCDKEVCLVVYGGEKNREIVNNLIVEAGYEPSDYGIQYVGEG